MCGDAGDQLQLAGQMGHPDDRRPRAILGAPDGPGYAVDLDDAHNSGRGAFALERCGNLQAVGGVDAADDLG